MPKIVATKEDWIKLGYNLFTQSGEMGLNVDQMSRTLKCNKSSFYWHFNSKKEFINELIEYWISLDTEAIINEVIQEKSAHKKFLRLLKIAFQKDANLDFIFYLKKYAQFNKPVARIVDEIDQQRIDFTADLLIEMGYAKKEALFKAQFFYKYLIGYHEMMRYKEQKRNYMNEVKAEINQFISIE